MLKLYLPIIWIMLTLFANATEPDSILGEWLVKSKDAKVKIYKKDGKYFGKLSWIKKDKSKKGEPIDENNPDESKRNRKLLGINLLKNLEYKSGSVWEDGNIYDPRSGKTYDCKIELKDNGKKLEVRGFLGFSLLGKSQIWTKAE
jgi:uncharacterized protein (DUF2147 family)